MVFYSARKCEESVNYYFVQKSEGAPVTPVPLVLISLDDDDYDDDDDDYDDADGDNFSVSVYAGFRRQRITFIFTLCVSNRIHNPPTYINQLKTCASLVSWARVHCHNNKTSSSLSSVLHHEHYNNDDDADDDDEDDADGGDDVNEDDDDDDDTDNDDNNRNCYHAGKTPKRDDENDCGDDLIFCLKLTP